MRTANAQARQGLAEMMHSAYFLGANEAVQPEFNTLQVNSHDLIMLCSDGLMDTLSDAQLAHVLQSHNAPGDAVKH
jgi:serine/threonine protein phosphatase PrpC